MHYECNLNTVFNKVIFCHQLPVATKSLDECVHDQCVNIVVCVSKQVYSWCKEGTGK